MRKCLIVQFEPRHEEVIPSVIAACNGVGYKPTVLLNRRILRVRGDVFTQVKGGEADIRYQSLSTDLDDADMDWDALLKDVDFVVLNTLNRKRAAAWAKHCGKPVIAIIHNVDQFMKEPAFSSLLERPDFAFMTLASHVTAEMNARTGARFVDKLGLLTYCVLSDAPVPYDVSHPRKVVVPGNLSLNSRNYTGLMETLLAHPGRWDNLVFEFPSSGADRDAVAAEITKNGLDNKVHILPLGDKVEIPHSEVFASFRSATVFHPLIADGFTQYQRIKITSTASMSVGFGVPMIMDRYSEACYSFPMLVSDNTVKASLDRLARVEDDELRALNEALQAYRANRMEHSAAEIARLIGRIC
jgi:hypothetical protein